MFPKAIIFDLDDTLIALKDTANETWKILADEYATKNKKVGGQVLYDTITETRLRYWEDEKNNLQGRKNQKEARREIIGRVFKKLDLPIDEANDLADDYSNIRLENLKLFPKVIETLEFLKQKGIILALITNGEAKIQRCKIEKFNLESFFECILIETEIGYGKPDSRIYKKAMRDMGVTSRETRSVGDNLIWDIKAPQSLGIYISME